MDALRASSAVPNFVQIFNVLHADHLSLPKLDIDEYEISLLPPTDPKTDEYYAYDPAILTNIIIKLLKGCGQAYVREETCYDILRSLAIRKWHVYAQAELPCPFLRPLPPLIDIEDKPSTEQASASSEPEATISHEALEDKILAEESTQENIIVDESNSKLGVVTEKTNAPLPLIDDTYIGFHDIPPAMKAEVMLVLMNCWMMGHLVKVNFIDTFAETDRLRVIPIGTDQKACNYYYLFGTRLYKESNIKYDPETGTGSFTWELVTSEAEGFHSTLAALKKVGSTGKNMKQLIAALENTVLPALEAAFEEKNHHDMQRRMEQRRRRAAAVALMKEKAKQERQEAAAARITAKRLRSEEGDRSGRAEKRQSTAALRAERYKRRSQLLEQEDVPARQTLTSTAAVTTQATAPRVLPVVVKEPKVVETREDLMAKAKRLVLEFFLKKHVQWPDINQTAVV
ncbi:hypothetical protein RvY_02793 [Ramazzottius varieornatus]|uniref:DDT domain-containing protein n=1 Tax=Ramazzottius varieornatus TaxID=947166 RepID=A0A1D1UPD0_RAMVA|nr:hypothetical protein RvY_02793 [Ramazzottius varieornatus]